MNHIEEFELHEYVDGEGSERRRSEIEQHLRTCRACRLQLAEVCSLFATIQAMPEVALTRDLSAEVVASIQTPTPEIPGMAWWLPGLQLISAAVAIPFAWRFLMNMLPAQTGLSLAVSWASLSALVLTSWQTLHAALSAQFEGMRVLTTQPLLPNLPLFTWAILVLIAALLWIGSTGWVIVNRSSEHDPVRLSAQSE